MTAEALALAHAAAAEAARTSRLVVEMAEAVRDQERTDAESSFSSEVDDVRGS